MRGCFVDVSNLPRALWVGYPLWEGMIDYSARAKIPSGLRTAAPVVCAGEMCLYTSIACSRTKDMADKIVKSHR